MKSKLFMRLWYAGLLLITAGGCFLWIENKFYQHVDNSGMLHESLWLPLGGFSLLLGFMALFIFTVRHALKVYLQMKNKS